MTLKRYDLLSPKRISNILVSLKEVIYEYTKPQ